MNKNNKTMLSLIDSLKTYRNKKRFKRGSIETKYIN